MSYNHTQKQLEPQKISFIVPVYNVDPFIGRCIESILSQNYQNIEVILVNDGSTDNSGKICDAYAKKDSRIQVIHQKNRGLSGARNKGLSLASGNYIVFVDSDDALAPHIWHKMVNYLEKNNLDILTGSTIRVRTNQLDSTLPNSPHELTIYTNEEIMKHCVEKDSAGAWGRLYRKKIVDNILYPEGRIFEDTSVIYQYMSKAQRIGYCSDIVYYYTYNPNSITQTAFSVKARYDYITAWQELHKFITTNYPQFQDSSRAQLLEAYLSFLTPLYAIGTDEEKAQYISSTIASIINLRSQGLNVYQHLKPKYKLLLFCAGRFDFINQTTAFLSYMWKKRKKAFSKK